MVRRWIDTGTVTECGVFRIVRVIMRRPSHRVEPPLSVMRRSSARPTEPVGDLYREPAHCVLRLLGALAVATVCAAPAPAADLFVSSADTNSVVRYDGKTGKLIGDFVPSGSAGLSGTHQPHLWAGRQPVRQQPLRQQHPPLQRQDRSVHRHLCPGRQRRVEHDIGLVFGPDGNLYVTYYYRNTFSASTEPRAPSSTRLFGGTGGVNGPGGIIFGPDGNLYVSSYNDSKVLCFDGKTGAFLRTVRRQESGGLNGPVGPAFGPDGSLYVSSRDSAPGTSLRREHGPFLGELCRPAVAGLTTRPV